MLHTDLHCLIPPKVASFLVSCCRKSKQTVVRIVNDYDTSRTSQDWASYSVTITSIAVSWLISLLGYPSQPAFDWSSQVTLHAPIERIQMTSWHPYWCSKTMTQRPCWWTKANPVRAQRFSYVNTCFCCKKIAWQLATWMEMLYTSSSYIYPLRSASDVKPLSSNVIWIYLLICWGLFEQTILDRSTNSQRRWLKERREWGCLKAFCWRANGGSVA